MLLTLLLERCYNVEVIPESFFNNMPRLYVLDLSYTSIHSLPVSISKLVTLRELLLKSCYYLNVLPVELSELKALEVLEVIEAKLNHPPLWIFELTNLKRLKILDIRRHNFVDSRHTHVPGLISKISQMEEFCVPNFLYDFGQLSNLAKLIIRDCDGLEGMISEDENVEYDALPKLKLVLLWYLPELVSFFKGVPMCWKSLESVQILSCPKLRKLPLDVNSATNLKEIQLYSRNCWDALEWDNNATKLRFH
ncbi:probable disease resistance protein At4g14610 [Actinidia eriantha]|uniref:probable disease resistance protein At4g14610 n=1 Tax=Actinidia eriantha TaxID=165200 RepID=UPI00258B958F|nr:probable disease resistance protein At4g14610 [Actinidia eriantha]